jgi:hypothetical protein
VVEAVALVVGELLCPLALFEQRNRAPRQTVRPFAGDQRRRDLQPSVGEIRDLFQTVYLARRLPVLDDTSKEMSARTDPDLRRYRLDRNRRRR